MELPDVPRLTPPLLSQQRGGVYHIRSPATMISPHPLSSADLSISVLNPGQKYLRPEEHLYRGKVSEFRLPKRHKPTALTTTRRYLVN